jgi:hypothetical protein
MPVFQVLLQNFLDSLTIPKQEEIIVKVKNNEREGLQREAKRVGGEIREFAEKIKRLIMQGERKNEQPLFSKMKKNSNQEIKNTSQAAPPTSPSSTPASSPQSPNPQSLPKSTARSRSPSTPASAPQSPA